MAPLGGNDNLRGGCGARKRGRQLMAGHAVGWQFSRPTVGVAIGVRQWVECKRLGSDARGYELGTGNFQWEISATWLEHLSL